MPSQTLWDTLLFPPPGSNLPPNPRLAADQQVKLKSLEEHFGHKDFRLPIELHHDNKSGLTEREMMFLSRETFLRFLIATKGDLHAAIGRLEDCLIWRRTERIDDIDYMAADCEDEAKTGKQIVLGTSNLSQPILYFFPNRNTRPVEERRAVHAVFMLERAIDLRVAGVTNIVVIFNFSGTRQGPPTSISVARETLHILSNYYPETLGRSIFQNMPWIVRAFVNLMWPFVDPNTKKKVVFGSVEGQEASKQDYVAPDQLLTECGGELNITYDHSAYWPALLDTCKRLRADEEERWRALGSPQVGRAETLFKRQPEGHQT